MPAKKQRDNEYNLLNGDYSFLQEYFSNGFNGTQAAKEVFNCQTDKSAATKASEVLRKPEVKEALAREMECLASAYQVSKESIVRELAILGFSDIRDYIDFAGDTAQLKSSDQIGVKAKAIKEITITPIKVTGSDGESTMGNKINLKLYDKQKSLELLGKTLDMFSEKAEVSIQDNKIVIERHTIKSKEDVERLEKGE